MDKHRADDDQTSIGIAASPRRRAEALEYDRVRRRLDRLVEMRFSDALDPSERTEFEELLHREGVLLGLLSWAYREPAVRMGVGDEEIAGGAAGSDMGPAIGQSS